MDIIEDFEEEEQDEKLFSQEYTDTSGLKIIKEISQDFLLENNYDLGKEPLFKDYTEEEFIKHIEKNQDPDIMKKFNESNIVENFRSSMSNIYIEKKTKTKMFIFFLPTSSLSSSVGIDVVKKFSKLVLIFGCNEGVLISEKPLTSKSKEILEYSNTSGEDRENVYNIISYVDDEFFNITDHCLSPKILKIYSGKELEEFVEKENIDPKNLPRITINDPIVKFYRARIGDVIKMKRKTGISGSLINEQIVYRFVIHTQFKNKK
jgi:DNA-directed RNA polymerase subunit H (RpoH/RPB5)